MNIKAQIGMVLNLDKCIGCHTCSVSCKNVWTSREGVEYAWFNNVETKPGIGYPNNWEDQEHYKGGWVLKNGKLKLKAGNKVRLLSNIFVNQNMLSIDDYYEPFTFDYTDLTKAPRSNIQPIAKPRSIITKKPMDKITSSANWEDMLGGEFAKRSKDKNFDGVQKEVYKEFENTFMSYLPRLCEHCLNPACVASCPSGAMYKREEDGVVLVDQEKCRGWRMCVSSCPYKKVYFNWRSGKSEKCIMCYPRLEAGQPTVCSETCVGRIRYLGVILYDADKIASAGSVDNEQDLYKSQLDVFLDPHDEEVQAQALKAGISQTWIDAAMASPVYKMAVEWKIALPLHPEYRTLPMVWYIPPLSPLQKSVEKGELPNDGLNGLLPKIEDMQIPLKYLANLLSAGDTEVIAGVLGKIATMRQYMREKTIFGRRNKEILDKAGLTTVEVEEMYRYLALAHYDDRFVIPTKYVDAVNDAFGERTDNGLDFNCSISDETFGGSGGMCGGATPKRKNLFGGN